MTPARGAPAGLVAAYSFDQGSGTSVTDASGNNNNGSIVGATWTTAGKFNGALSFNGTSSRVDIPNSASLQLTSAMTLEAWVNPTAVTSKWRDVIEKGNDNYYLMGTSSHASTPAGSASASGIHAQAFGTAPLATNTFTHLAATYDGATLKLYVGGNLVGSKAAAGALATSTNPLQIGGDSIYGQFFAGTIDEVRVYNTALTQAQIQTDMATAIGSGGSSDNQKPTPPSNLTATPASATQINLSWTASSDNVVVTTYRIERCQGTGCANTPTNFAQIGTVTGNPPTTTYNNTGLAANTSYSYRVRATDAVPNLSDYSNVANATTSSSGPATPTFVQVNSATPQTNQSTVAVIYISAQTAGNANILAIGWNDATSNIASVTDSVGNTYQVAAPTARGTGLSQAIYYAKNIKAAPAGGNTVTVTFNTAVRFADIRILEYSGLDTTNPFDATASASGTIVSANSGNAATTTSPVELVFGAGMTVNSFTAAGAGFTKRIITTPDADIAEDRTVTAIGTYSATAQQNTSGGWVMQVATFRAAGA